MEFFAASFIAKPAFEFIRKNIIWFIVPLVILATILLGKCTYDNYQEQKVTIATQAVEIAKVKEEKKEVEIQKEIVQEGAKITEAVIQQTITAQEVQTTKITDIRIETQTKIATVKKNAAVKIVTATTPEEKKVVEQQQSDEIAKIAIESIWATFCEVEPTDAGCKS